MLLAYIVLGTSLLVGLLVYERHDLRLGGVLVLPLLVVYALFSPRILPLFFGAALLTYAAGEGIRSRTLLYGRRLLYAYLLVGLVTSAVLIHSLLTSYHGVAFAVLPGIFAFNMHREPRPARAMGSFAAILVPVFLIVHVALFPIGFAGGLFAEIPVTRAIVAQGYAGGYAVLVQAPLSLAARLGTAGGGIFGLLATGLSTVIAELPSMLAPLSPIGTATAVPTPAPETAAAPLDDGAIGALIWQLIGGPME